MPKEEVDIHLLYDGPDVEDGTMSLQDIVPVLQGFSSAYGKLAATDDPSSTHKLRISAVRPGSADIVLEAWKTLASTDTTNVLANAAILGGGAYFIVSKIAGVIRLKKHVHKGPYAERISATNSIVVSNAENVTVEVPLDVYELFKSGLLDRDLSRITSPLQVGKIDMAEIQARAADGTVLRERITAEERPYFDVTTVSVTDTGETWLVVKLNSLTKTTDSGWLYLTDGTRAFYRYVGEDPLLLHQLFGSYDGPVRVRCVAHMDENLKIVSLDVFEVERVQGSLFTDAPPTHDEDAEDEQ